MMSFQRASMRTVVFLSFSLLMLASAGCKRILEAQVAAGNPYPESSPLHKPAGEMMMKMMQNPRFAAQLKQSKDKANAQQIGMKLAQDGMPSLPMPALEQRVTLMNTLLKDMDEATCAYMAAPVPGKQAEMMKGLNAALEKQSPQVIEQWFELSYQAMVAGLDAKPPAPLNEQAVGAAFEVILGRLPQDDQMRLVQTVNNLATASPKDLCWTARTLYGQTATLPTEHRRTLARAFIQE